MRQRRKKHVVLDPEDFSGIALEKCAQRAQDMTDIAAGRRTPNKFNGTTICWDRSKAI
jgi:hypothetical protein